MLSIDAIITHLKIRVKINDQSMLKKT